MLEPDVVLVQDRTLPGQRERFAGLRPEGYVLINSSRSAEELGLGDLIASSRGARPHGSRHALRDGKIGRPLPSAAMLAGMAAMTGTMKLESVQAAYNENSRAPLRPPTPKSPRWPSRR